MMALQQLWNRLVEPDPSIADAEERRQARFVLSLLVSLVPIGLALSALAPGIATGDWDPRHQNASFVGLGCTFLLMATYLVGRGRYHQVAAAMVVAIVTAAAWGSFVAARHEPNSAFILSFLGLGLLLSGILLPFAGTVTLCILDIVGLLALPVLFPDLPIEFAVIPGLFVVVTAFLVTISSAVRVGDSRERRRAEGALRAEEERYRTLVESSPDGIVLVSSGRIVYGNPSAARLFGAAEPVDLLGLSPLEDLVVPAYVKVIEERMAAIEKLGARTKPLEIRVRRLDGTELDVEVMGAPALHEGRPADQTIVRDITARKEAENARSRIERLEEINALKTQLLNMASHELNTPIAALRLQLHMLKLGEKEQDPRRAKAMMLLDRNVERLALLVKDVLDVARMQSGQLKVRKEFSDLAPVVEEAADLYTQAYLDKGVSLEIVTAPAMVHADAQRLTQVLVNLLSNALKFTDPGGCVKLSLSREQGYAIVRVQDSGSGLTEEQMAKLFQAFSQVHDIALESKGGTGLGLHISRGIIDQHEGRIWCESQGPGCGTTFAFALPLATALAAPDTAPLA